MCQGCQDIAAFQALVDQILEAELRQDSTHPLDMSVFTGKPS